LWYADVGRKAKKEIVVDLVKVNNAAKAVRDLQVKMK
jgi:hypothetical protein